VFGGGLGTGVLPVFHFHDVTRDDLEPKLRYLAENGYRTVIADQIAAHAGRTARLDRRSVALCFDDAWASLWTVAAPLLKQYGMTGIAFAIPGRMTDAAATRPARDDPASPTDGSPFVTWPELRALDASGVIDVQSHTETHSRIFVSNELIGFVTPGYVATPFLNRPQLAPPPDLRFVTAAELGAPLYPARSRMSDGARAAVPLDLHRRCVELVAKEGGAAFFRRPTWRTDLRRVVRARGTAARESDAEQTRAIEEELSRGRAVLNERLRSNRVNHVCLPWGVAGRRTRAALERLGYRSAFANRLRGMHAVRPGDDIYWLKRLPNKYIFRLPRRGR
jgi:hypothetical protein